MPLNIDWQQILLHAFNLVLLFAIFYLLLYKPVKKFMDGRKEYYENLDKEAKDSIEKGKEMQKEYEKRLVDADADIVKMRENAQKEADAMSNKVLEEAKDAAELIIKGAKNEAKREKERILSEASDEISKIVTDATSKIVYENTDSAYENFLNEVEDKKDE